MLRETTDKRCIRDYRGRRNCGGSSQRGKSSKIAAETPGTIYSEHLSSFIGFRIPVKPRAKILSGQPKNPGISPRPRSLAFDFRRRNHNTPIPFLPPLFTPSGGLATRFTLAEPPSGSPTKQSSVKRFSNKSTRDSPPVVAHRLKIFLFSSSKYLRSTPLLFSFFPSYLSSFLLFLCPSVFRRNHWTTIRRTRTMGGKLLLEDRSRETLQTRSIAKINDDCPINERE